MKAIFASFKKEYWEEKHLLLGLPVGLGLLVVLSLVIVLFVGGRYADNINIQGISWDSDRDDASLSLKFNEDVQPYSANDDDNVTSNNNHENDDNTRNILVGLIFVFISIAWFSGLSYALSSLYSDRKDKTVLFWKSLPVSEKMNVLVKFCFGSLGYMVVALVVAWITCIAIFGFIYVAQYAFDSGGLFAVTVGKLSFMNFVILPLVGMLTAAVWGAPLFTYVLFVSALVKRAPFFMAIWPPLSMVVVERIVFNSDHFLRFVISFFPFKKFANANMDGGVFSFLLSTLNGDGLNLIFGLFLAVSFVCAAIWLRDNRFEI